MGKLKVLLLMWGLLEAVAGWAQATGPVAAPGAAPVVAPVRSPVLALPDTTATYAILHPYLELLRSDTALTLSQVQAPRGAARFRPVPPGIPNYGADPADFWLRLRLQNQAHPRTAWVLDTRFGTHPFEVLTTDPAGRLLGRIIVDEAHFFAHGQAVPGRHPSVLLPLAAGQPTVLYIHTTGSLFLLKVRERTHELQTVRVADLKEAFYFGILLALALYNLGLFLSVRDRAYLTTLALY